MKRLAILLVWLVAGMAHAQMYRWVDKDGKVHFTDRPPPPQAAKEVQQRKLAAPATSKELPYAVRQAAANFPVTLYVSNECAACKEGREFLAGRGVPFTEKTVSSDEEIEALAKLLGSGEVRVPVIQVGDKLRKGYLESAWAGLLDAAGYPKSP